MKLGRELPSQIRISCVPLSKGRSFSSSNGRRSLLPAIEPTDTVDYTPSNKNQSASFPILFVFSFFFFLEFFSTSFFLFLLFYFYRNVFATTSPHTIFIQWIKNRGNFSNFSTLRICMRISCIQI